MRFLQRMFMKRSSMNLLQMNDSMFKIVTEFREVQVKM